MELLGERWQEEHECAARSLAAFPVGPSPHHKLGNLRVDVEGVV